MSFLLNAMVWIGTIILKGFVLKVLWGWFIVPLGVLAITIPQALGLSMLFALLIFNKQRKETPWKEVMENSIAISSAALLFGFIIQLLGKI